jgi:LmbE family N-acetylglucosaminyl deacetylase
MAEQTRPVFLAPHYDDVALSCGGTVALLAEQGRSPAIVTCFGGGPDGPLSPFAAFQHRWRGLADDEVLALRRAEERAAAAALGAEPLWLDLPDAVYRGDRYLSDEQLFGSLHPDDAELLPRLRTALTERLAAAGVAPAWFAVPLGIGNHVDHQLVRHLGHALRREGWTVWAYEDFPYSTLERGSRELTALARQHAAGDSWIQPLAAHQLEKRIAAVECYRSQLKVLFRDLGNPGEVVRRAATEAGCGRPAERLWRLRG